MNDEQIRDYAGFDSESLSEYLERDARRYDKSFTEEDEVRLI